MSRPVRRSQAVSTFGIGAMVDFPGPVSLIHAGLDAWPFDESNVDHREFRVDDEPRFARRLGVDFFVQPPDFRKIEPGRGDTPNVNLRLPFLRFPLWHACPRCGRMFETRYQQRSAPVCEGPIGSGTEKDKPHKRRNAVQVRFVSVCSDGHIRDFPWVEWLGLKREEWAPTQSDRWLRLLSTGSASIAGVVVVAEMKEGARVKEVTRRSLAGAFSVEPSGDTAFSRMGLQCDGQNPAIGYGHGGDSPVDPCGQHLRAILRGASNLYFADVRSSIYVPEIQDATLSQELLNLLDDHRFKQALLLGAQASETGTLGPRAATAALREWYPESKISAAELAEAFNKHSLHEILTGKTLAATALALKATDGRIALETLAAMLRDVFPDWAVDPALLVPQVNAWLGRRAGSGEGAGMGTSSSESDKSYRAEEYRAFCRDGHDGMPKTNLLVRSAPMDSYDELVRRNFSRVALLDKLRETRAFVGFSRVFAGGDSSSSSRWKLMSRAKTKWLPAVVVRGEGIFLVFDETRLSLWDCSFGNFHRDRLKRVNENLVAQSERRHVQAEPATPKFVMLHTFAHVLIGQLVFDCGYGSSSLRERIYCSDTHPGMSGVLIYTAAGDSEGTMGGLVRMGEPALLDRTIARALDRARWCSADPVCIDTRAQGPDNCNLAACHSCALLPETSCEQQNRLLDRGMLVGVLDRPDVGYFS